VGFKAYNLDQVIDGDLDAVITSLADAEMAEKLGGDEGNAGT
jgi:peptide chain release factor 1